MLALSEWQPVAIDRHVFDEAWRIQDRYGLSFQDGPDLDKPKRRYWIDARRGAE